MSADERLAPRARAHGRRGRGQEARRQPLGPGARRRGRHAARPGRGRRRREGAGLFLDEVREARLVPVIDFKGRRSAPAGRGDERRAPLAKKRTEVELNEP